MPEQEVCCQGGLLLPSPLAQLKQDALRGDLQLWVGNECVCKAQLTLLTEP